LEIVDAMNSISSGNTNLVTNLTQYSDKVYWCQTCNVPLLQSKCGNCGEHGLKMVSDIRPIFEGEKCLLEEWIQERLPQPANTLWMRRKIIWYQGRRYLSLSANGHPHITKRYADLSSNHSGSAPTPEVLMKANASVLKELETEAINFIKQTVDQLAGRIPVVSFSGGKDSTVISILVRKALGKDEIPHIFSDTTIEFPDTYEYFNLCRDLWPTIPWHVTASPNDWFEMCDLFRPPSRFLPWCCSVFKTSGVFEIHRRDFPRSSILNFQGIRAVESSLRRRLPRLHHSKKVSTEICAEPIFYWKDIHVWLYLLANKIPFNQAYRKGCLRVGCLYCPHQSEYQQTISESLYPEKMKQWRDYICDFATSLDKTDPQDYWESGSWKWRVGAGQQKVPPKAEARECSDGPNVINFILEEDCTDRCAEFLKPFGSVVSSISALGRFHVISGPEDTPLFQVQVVPGFPRARVIFADGGPSKALIGGLSRQLRKAQVCVACGACASTCPQKAIKVDGRFTIDDSRCTHCGLCMRTTRIASSCIALEVYRRRGERSGSQLQQELPALP